MTIKPKPRATISADGTRFTLRCGSWSSTFQIADLGDWIAFYTRQMKRKDGMYAEHYVAPLAALEGLRGRIAR